METEGNISPKVVFWSDKKNKTSKVESICKKKIIMPITNNNIFPYINIFYEGGLYFLVPF